MKNYLGAYWVAIRDHGEQGQFPDYETLRTVEMESRRAADKLDLANRRLGSRVVPVARFVEVELTERPKPFMGEYSEPHANVISGREREVKEIDLCTTFVSTCADCPGKWVGYGATFKCSCFHHRIDSGECNPVVVRSRVFRDRGKESERR